MDAVDFEQLAMELVRQWRGDRTQRALADELGYRSNVLYTWEAGRRFPLAAEALQLAEHCGVDLVSALADYPIRGRWDWVDEVEPATPEGVARLLRELKGRRKTSELTALTGASKFAWSRWLNGVAQPRLPDLLRSFSAMTVRWLDLLDRIADPSKLPAVAEHWTRARAAATLPPEAGLVAMALQLETYRSRDGHDDDWLARATGLAPPRVAAVITLLIDGGLISWDGTHWAMSEEQLPASAPSALIDQMARVYWGHRATMRLESDPDTRSAYVLSGVSAASRERVTEILRAAYRDIVTVMERPQPREELLCVMLHGFSVSKP